MAHHFFTSESVTEGHPDKICDQISDAILNEILPQDPYARVACETTCTTGMVQVMGEISTSCYVAVSYTHLHADHPAVSGGRLGTRVHAHGSCALVE